MRANKNNSPTPKNRSLEEPVYVDEIYTDESTQDDPWARTSTNEIEKPDATLEFEDDEVEQDEVEEEEFEEETPPNPTNSKNKTSPPRSFRLKNPSVLGRPTNQPRISNQKPLPTDLPRIVRRNRPNQLSDSRREERTGTWPVAPDPKRNGHTQPKNGLNTFQVPPERTNGQQPLKDKTHTNKSVSPNQPKPVNTPLTPPILVIPPSPKASPRIDEEETADTPRSMDTRTPPPLFPTMSSAPSKAPQGVLPVKDDLVSERSHFRPLVDETPDEEEVDENEFVETEENWNEGQAVPSYSSLHDLIEQINLPQNSLVLGVCDDGLPLVLELADPSPGALLFLGDNVEGLQKHLQSVLASVCLMSDPKQVQIDIISPSPKAFATQKLFPHVQKFHLSDQDEMYELLGCLFELVEQFQRKENSFTGKFLKDLLPTAKSPFRILMIDQLDVLVEQLAPESLSYLRWLLRRGPAANVWVLASLNTQNAETVDGKTLKSFGLRINGKIQNLRQANRLTNVPAEKLSSLVPGEKACLKLDEDIIEFSILE